MLAKLLQLSFDSEKLCMSKLAIFTLTVDMERNTIQLL
ncbi:hypothetical protein [Klebsiella pneumoniae ISC21]|nr:hypothetical protein [Klebsiella pneumoniae ISC21]